MPNPYRELFEAPGSTRFVLAGLIARTALPMTGIGIITLLSQLNGGFALAGAVSGTFVLAYALVSPQISRLVDRHGQSRVIPSAALLCLLGLTILLVSTWLSLPYWTLFIGAGFAGTMPSVSALVRARWTEAYRDHPRLQTAFSLETVLDELTFVAGPPLSVGLSVAVFPQAGLLLAAILLAVGVGALISQRETEPAVVVPKTATGQSSSALGRPIVQLLACLMLTMGIIVGTVDVASVAFAAQATEPAAASLILSAYAVGSCLAGLLFGLWKTGIPLARLLLLGGTATAVTTLPLLLAETIPHLAAVVFVAGLFFAPTMIVAMSLVERAVPAAQLTEGMTWLLAGLNVGVATGAVISGQIIDLAGVRAGFAVAVCGAALVLIAGWLVSLHLRGKDCSELVQESSTRVPDCS